jgi:hypothetical protein
MVKGKVVALGIGIIFLFLILSWLILPLLGFEIEFLSSPYGMIFISVTGMLFALSGFLPYKWGKILREIALFCLFIMILLVEINIVKPFVKATKVDMTACQNYFQPSTTGQVVYDALKYTSCVFTGYFPTTEGDLGWTVFYIFYLILPFAFIWLLIYSIIKSIMEGWFPVQFNISALLSFIIALYSSRTLMGGFLLDFAGYAAWGLGAIFLAIIFTKGLDKIMKDWYKTEEMAKETREAIESELDIEKSFAQSFKPVISEAKRLASSGPSLLKPAKYKLMEIKDTPQWKALPSSTQAILEEYLNKAYTAGTTSDFLNYVNNIEQFLKSLEKVK